MCDFDIMERNYSNTSMTNYVRLCYVAHYENRKLLVELLQFETSKVSIPSIMTTMQLEHGLRKEDMDILRECFNSQCFAKLSGRLLNKVLTKSELVDPPANGWYKTPRTCTAINTIGDCVDVINLEYNLIFHSGKTDFTDEEVRDIFLLFKAIARKFAQWLNKDEGELVSRYEKIESCCFDIEMRSKYREHLHLLESGLKANNQPRFHPNIYETDSFQLSTEVTNTMRVIYAIQVVLTKEFNKYIKSRKSLEELQSETWGKERHRIRQAYGHFSLSFIQKIVRNRVIDDNSLSKNMYVIITERNNILSEPNASMEKYPGWEKSLRVLKKIAKDLEQEMQLPTGKLVVKLEYYETCCMDDQVSNWYHNSLIDLAAKEQQFGTSIHYLQDAERTTRYWYLPDVSVLEIAPHDPVSLYVLIGYTFEERLPKILQELLSHHVPHCLLFDKIFCSQLSADFNAENFLLIFESQKNGYSDFDTMLIASVMLALVLPVCWPISQKIMDTKRELLKKEKKGLTGNEMQHYFNIFKDIEASVEKILLNQMGHLVENLENLFMKGEQLKDLIAYLVEKAQKQQKPNWMKKRSVVKRSPLLDSKEFYELLKLGVYISYENRLYFGGPCNAGKTSLACILTGDEVPDTWISTNGLQIYFGHNGIHLKDKKMIPIRKDMICHTVHGKVISAMDEKQKKDITPNPKANSDENKEVNRVESTEIVLTGYEVEESSSKTKFEHDCEKDGKVNLKKTFKEKFDTDETSRSKHTTKITEPRSSIKHVKPQSKKTELLKLAQTPTTKDYENDESDSSAAKKPKLSLTSKQENTQTEIIKKNVNPNPEFSKTQISKSSGSSKTLNVIQDETLRKSILDEVRNGEYNLEIAPSDLVDFGGQKAFDMTHQLFILKEGTVLLLFDGSKDLEEPLPEYPGNNISSADILLHWVDSVTSYCTDEIGMHRIQFVATHSDSYKDNVEIRRKALVKQLTATFINHESKSCLDFDNLFFIDARNKDDNEIDKLKDKLVEIAFSQKSWGKKMPLIWVPLENQLLDLKLKGISILRMEEIQKLNRLNEDLMMNDEKLMYFLQTQHALGKLIFFDKDELAEFVIIEPSVLVNALRSFVTDEIFFPQQDRECYNILKKLQREGTLKKIDLMKLWNQDEFQVIFPTQDFKDFLVKILLHLDVLVEPPLDNQDVSFSEEYYIVPSMVQNRFDNDYVETYLNRSRSICMSYVFKLNMAPPNVLFGVIAAAVGIFPQKEYRKQKMICQDGATFVFDEKNEFSIKKKGNRIIVYFTHANSTRKIQPSKVASVQEWLTTVILSIIEFYQLISRGIDASHQKHFGKPFEPEYGAACQTPCFVKNEEEIRRSKAGVWKCRHDQLHEVDYLWYWDSKKFQENIEINVTKEIKLSPTVLMKTPTTELLKKLSFELGTNGTRLGDSLGIDRSVIKNNIIVNKYNVFKYTQKILELLDESVTVEDLVKALENIGSRGLETIAKYYSHKPVKRCRSKSVPFLLFTKEDLTDEKDWFFKLKISCDKYDMHLIIDHNLQTKYKSLAETVNKTVTSQQKKGTKRKRKDIEDSSTSSEECHDSSINEDISIEGLKIVKPKQSVFEQIYKQTNCKSSIISVEYLYENQDLLYRFILARNLCPSDVLYILRKAMDYQLHVISKAFSWYFLRSAINQTNISDCFNRVKDIWPGFVCRCNKDKKGHSAICSKEPIIVVDADEYLEGFPKEIDGIPVTQSAHYLKAENTEDKSDALVEEDSTSYIYNRRTISAKHAEKLFLQHTKLTLVYISINEPGCVQLGCQAKGIIPMGEEHLPIVVCSINTKVLHGNVSFLHKEKHKMHVGSKIGPATKTSWGTLGGFVERRRQKAFLTCSHVMYDRKSLLSGSNRNKNAEEVKVKCYLHGDPNEFICGTVIDDVFLYDNSDGTSIDAAVVVLDESVTSIDTNEVVQITNSLGDQISQPLDFLGMTTPYLNDNYKLHKMDEGTMKARLVGAKSGCFERNVSYEDYDNIKENFQDDRQHGVTAQWSGLGEEYQIINERHPKPLLVGSNVHFSTVTVPNLDKKIKHDRGYVYFYNQLLMENLPFEHGDSGTCIYIVEDKSYEREDKQPNSKGCIGMAIGSYDDIRDNRRKIIVTPMHAILKALKLI